MSKWKGLIEEYKDLLPVGPNTPKVTLNEGNTPLIFLNRLSEKLGVEAYAKVEGANPTGSFKDRGMVMAIAKAVEEGSKAVICASTGNTSASAAAYAARSGLRCIIVIPEGKIAQGKLAQAYMYGAEVFEIKGNFDQALQVVRQIAENDAVTLVNSVNPYRIDGQQTAAFEICDVLGDAPDYLCIPVGNAGNITAYWKGFKAYHEKFDYKLPHMMGFEASGSAAIVRDQVIEEPETIATAIRIGNPASWKGAVDARDSSEGIIDEVTDEEIVEAYHWLAQNEGIFAEPASCASIAGLMKSADAGRIQKGSKVVCVLTGNGLKDPVTAIETNSLTPRVLSGSLDDIYVEIKKGIEV